MTPKLHNSTTPSLNNNILMHKTHLAADRAVAIIIVTYNRVANLRVTLEACLAQQGDFHVLVVNNASTDDTAKYLEQAAARGISTVDITTHREHRWGWRFCRRPAKSLRQRLCLVLAHG